LLDRPDNDGFPLRSSNNQDVITGQRMQKRRKWFNILEKQCPPPSGQSEFSRGLGKTMAHFEGLKIGYNTRLAQSLNNPTTTHINPIIPCR
jgi:hypothetical protein